MHTSPVSVPPASVSVPVPVVPVPVPVPYCTQETAAHVCFQVSCQFVVPSQSRQTIVFPHWQETSGGGVCSYSHAHSHLSSLPAIIYSLVMASSVVGSLTHLVAGGAPSISAAVAVEAQALAEVRQPACSINASSKPAASSSVLVVPCVASRHTGKPLQLARHSSSQQHSSTAARQQVDCCVSASASAWMLFLAYLAVPAAVASPSQR